MMNCLRKKVSCQNDQKARSLTLEWSIPPWPHPIVGSYQYNRWSCDDWGWVRAVISREGWRRRQHSPRPITDLLVFHVPVAPHLLCLLSSSSPSKCLLNHWPSLLHSSNSPSPVCIVLRQTSSNLSSCFFSGSVVNQGYNQLAKTRIQIKLLWWTSCYFWSITDVISGLYFPSHQRKTYDNRFSVIFEQNQRPS